jgi:hypothetical protein
MRKLLEAIGIVALLFLGWITWRALAGPDHLPDRIPTHFDIAGQPNGWGSPDSLWLLPAFGLLIYLTISVVERFPWGLQLPGPSYVRQPGCFAAGGPQHDRLVEG